MSVAPEGHDGSWQPPPPPPPSPPVAPETSPPAALGPPAPPTNSMAMVSLVLGIVSIAMCQLTGPVGIWAGLRARKEIAESGEQGDGIAVAGIVTSAIGTALLGLFLLVAVIIVAVAIGAAASST